MAERLTGPGTAPTGGQRMGASQTAARPRLGEHAVLHGDLLRLRQALRLRLGLLADLGGALRTERCW